MCCEAICVKVLESCCDVGASREEALVFGGLLMDVWAASGTIIGNYWDGFSSGLEDGGSGGAFDAVVCGVWWDCGVVNPAFSLAGVELESEIIDVLGDGRKCSREFGMVCDDVDVVHVSSGGCIRGGTN